MLKQVKREGTIVRTGKGTTPTVSKHVSRKSMINRRRRVVKTHLLKIWKHTDQCTRCLRAGFYTAEMKPSYIGFRHYDRRRNARDAALPRGHAIIFIFHRALTTTARSANNAGSLECRSPLAAARSRVITFAILSCARLRFAFRQWR